MPALIHHVHLTPQAERTRGQASAFLAQAPGAKQLIRSLRDGSPWNPGMGVGWETGGGGGGGGAVMPFHSCQNWQFSSVFCEFTLGMA